MVVFDSRWLDPEDPLYIKYNGKLVRNPEPPEYFLFNGRLSHENKGTYH